MYLNKAFVIGNLTRDPEVKALPSGTKVCTFSVATNRIFKDKEGQRQETAEYHNIVAFSKLAELSGQYLKKGQQVLVEGRMQTRTWESNGEKKYRTEIVADTIQFGAKSNNSGTASTGAKKEGSVSAPTPGEEEANTKDNKIDYPTEEINPEDIPF